MDDIHSSLAHRAIANLAALQPHKSRLLVAFAGPPGSGKSSISDHVAARINQTLRDPNGALVVSIDGFHLPRAALDALPNRDEAHARRGAHWTFDAEAAVSFIRKVSQRSQDEGALYAPTFDHAIKDPITDGLHIPSESKIIIFEGLYLLCDLQPWSDIASFVDEKWFVDVDEQVARRRVAQRHVRSGIEPNMHSAFKRVDENDAANGKWVRERRVEVDVLVTSIEDQV